MDIHIRLPDDLGEKLSKYAKENDMSKNKAVRKALREMLKRQEQPQKTA